VHYGQEKIQFLIMNIIYIRVKEVATWK